MFQKSGHRYIATIKMSPPCWIYNRIALTGVKSNSCLCITIKLHLSFHKSRISFNMRNTCSGNNSLYLSILLDHFTFSIDRNFTRSTQGHFNLTRTGTKRIRADDCAALSYDCSPILPHFTSLLHFTTLLHCNFIVL